MTTNVSFSDFIDSLSAFRRQYRMEFVENDFKVGAWTIEPSRLRVSRGHTVRSIDPKPMSVLVILARAAGRVVTRDELFTEVWGDAIVVDGALTRCISELRRVFEDANHDAVIETVRGVGYRLIPEVRPAANSTPRRESFSIGGSKAIERSRAHFAILAGTIAVVAGLSIAIAAIVVTPRGEPRQTITAQTLTFQPGMEREARISPDGAAVAYVSSSGRGLQSIFVQPTTTPDPRDSVGLVPTVGPAHGIVAPAWSPGSDRLAYMLKTDASCEIRVVTLVDRTDQRIGGCGENYHDDLAWSRDDTWLAFSDKAPGGALGISLLSIDGKERRFITDPAGTKYGDHYPAFSPDGASIAFVRTQFEDAADVFITDLFGTGTRRVTEQLRSITGVAWWGEELVFSTKLGGPFQLWTVPVSAGKPVDPRWLPVGAAETHSPSTSIDGSKLVFQSDLSVVNTRVWRSEDPDITSDFALSARVDVSPALSPDGSRAAFVSSRRGTREIWIQRMDGTGLQQLTDIGGGYVDSPVWSPDGSQIVFAASVDANSDLYSIDVGSREVARVTTDDADDVLPQYRPGGESLAFASDRSGDWQIWELDLASGVEKMLTKEGGFAVRFHPDGRRVFVAGPHHPGIRLLEHDGSLGEVVVSDLHELDWGAWDVVAGGIFYVVRSSSHPWLAFSEFNRRDPRQVVQLSERDVWSVPWGRTVLDAAPDGSTVLYSRYDQAESEVVLVTTTNANGPAR